MVAQSVKRPELRSLIEVQLSQNEFDSWLRHKLGEKILAGVAVGVGGKTHSLNLSVGIGQIANSSDNHF